ncbi:hypothetical protein FJU08_18745 [Martelella alba]|uniref:Uncharacterized protein n=1 Tax=Martelella alba TaxID=2590451 RepID=A0A506U450_9HYPH|nr:hypothetical protein [Martelella alba]TPW28081.1 hypothetical protein FJU08_18745 [Martelella alba]
MSENISAATAEKKERGDALSFLLARLPPPPLENALSGQQTGKPSPAPKPKLSAREFETRKQRAASDPIHGTTTRMQSPSVSSANARLTERSQSAASSSARMSNISIIPSEPNFEAPTPDDIPPQPNYPAPPPPARRYIKGKNADKRPNNSSPTVARMQDRGKTRQAKPKSFVKLMKEIWSKIGICTQNKVKPMPAAHMAIIQSNQNHHPLKPALKQPMKSRGRHHISFEPPVQITRL